MTLATACPKPVKRSDSEARVEKIVKAWARTNRWRQQAIARAKGKPRTKVKERNEDRIARKAKAYRTVIASAGWKKLRRQVFERDGGLCQCPDCIALRKAHPEAIESTLVPVWFDTAGRPHGFDVHHTTYVRFGREELSDLLLMKRSHHQKYEALNGTRRRFLKGK
ncbi:MAG TPA: hypothetical protein VN717_08650 [Gemmatimonadaceae bacterium]|nr:hypothetical protein [Gemmatimonadaceae bacterium]